MKTRFAAAFAALFISATATSAATISLDFEDQQLPLASGWQAVSGGTSTVIAGTVPVKTGSYVLNITGQDSFGWFFDLSGLIAPNSSWEFNADIQRVRSVNLGGGGINDIGISKFGGGTDGSINIGSITDQNWHAFSMVYDSLTATFTGAIDGNAVSVFTAPFLGYASEGMAFIFGNINVEKSVNFDNIEFSFNPASPSEIPLPASAVLLLGGLGILAARRKSEG